MAAIGNYGTGSHRVQFREPSTDTVENHLFQTIDEAVEYYQRVKASLAGDQRLFVTRSVGDELDRRGLR